MSSPSYTYSEAPPMKLTPEEQKLIRLIREVGWGAVKNIVVKDGRPVMATTERDVKLT